MHRCEIDLLKWAESAEKKNMFRPLARQRNAFTTKKCVEKKVKKRECAKNSMLGDGVLKYDGWEDIKLM